MQYDPDRFFPSLRRRCPIGKSLVLLCLLLYVDASTLAFATTALLLVYGRFHEPWKIAVFGGFASALGSATQLLLLRWLLASNQPWMRRFTPSRVKIEEALKQFPSASFLALTVARATPQQINAMVARDTQNPRGERLVGVVTVERSISTHEDLLRRVFSLHRAAEQPPTQSEHATVVVPVKRLEVDFQYIPCTALSGTQRLLLSGVTIGMAGNYRTPLASGS